MRLIPPRGSRRAFEVRELLERNLLPVHWYDVDLAGRARSVRVVVRGKALKSTMSHYLIDRLTSHPRIEVLTETELTALHGTTTVERVTLRDKRDGSSLEVEGTAAYVMIGADPCTEACQGMLAVDPAGYLLCGGGTDQCENRLCWPLKDRDPHMLETVRPGVFAAGDVVPRPPSGSPERSATAP